MFSLAWLFQYALGGFFALFVAAYVLSKRSPESQTTALKSFYAFGLLIALWEFASFFQRTAATPEFSLIFLYIILATSCLSQPTYLLTILSIQKEKKYALLVFVPAVIRLITFAFLDIPLVSTEFGWTSVMPLSGLALEVGTAIYFGYFIAIIFILFDLTRKARSTILKNKYRVLLVSFTLFQVVGFTLTNYIFTFAPNFPPFGGILQFLTFVAIGYALILKEPRIPSSASNLNDFPEVYSSFLTEFYNQSIDTNLGEASFKFTEFLQKSHIENMTSVKEDKISFMASDDLDLAQLINNNLKFLEEESDNNLSDVYLRVLNSASLKLGDKFAKVVIDNVEYLEKSDLLYGISGGDYLKFVDKDNSLDNLSDIDACLKIYKRLLLLAVDKLSFSAFQKRVAFYQATKAVTITKYGEISIEATRDEVNRFAKDQRLAVIIESFNPLVSWVYETVLSDMTFADSDLLTNLRLALRLNREKAIQLRIYPTLLERLAAKIPKEEIEQLYHEYLEEIIEQKSGELKQVRNRLIEAERLSAIGRTTAMVGHDLRNPLQVIINTLYLARMKLELIPPQIEKEELVEIYNRIESQVLYMDKIVTDLQDFSRPVTVKPIKTDLKDLFEEVLSSISVPENINVSVKTDRNAPVIRVDPASMKRVFYNLVLNAIQAMPDGGNLTVSITSNDENTVITVEDTGVGISEESKSRIFEPFFTTKAQGQGLGLSICKKFVEANGGSIEVQSEEKKGTIFKIKLPIK